VYMYMIWDLHVYVYKKKYGFKGWDCHQLITSLQASLLDIQEHACCMSEIGMGK